MTRKFIAALATTVGLALATSQAHATTFTGSWQITNYASLDPALVVKLSQTSGTFNFDLAPDNVATPQNEELKTLNLFSIYTNEGSLEFDDFVPQPIQLQFTFDAPTPNSGAGALNGFTAGYYLVFSQGGYLDWSPSDPTLNGKTQLNYGPNNDGLLSVYVNGGTYNEGCGLFCGTSIKKGPTKALTVQATFDWDRDASPAAVVPEPATWALMIGGFGMAGAALRRRRTLTAA